MNACEKITVSAVILLVLACPAFASGNKMKAPPVRKTPVHSGVDYKDLETSCVDIVLNSGIRLFQERISRIDGPRCGFSPTCSAYARQALREQGGVVGLMMTGDRLIRCNHWSESEERYEVLENGRLYDPLSDNLVLEGKDDK